MTTFRRFRCNDLLRFTSNKFDSRKHYGGSRGTRRALVWPCNDSHCRARILQAEVTKKLMNLLEDINDWIDMRKALSRDVEKKSIMPPKRPVTSDELECD